MIGGCRLRRRLCRAFDRRRCGSRGHYSQARAGTDAGHVTQPSRIIDGLKRFNTREYAMQLENGFLGLDPATRRTFLSLSAMAIPSGVAAAGLVTAPASVAAEDASRYERSV